MPVAPYDTLFSLYVIRAQEFTFMFYDACFSLIFYPNTLSLVGGFNARGQCSLS